MESWSTTATAATPIEHENNTVFGAKGDDLPAYAAREEHEPPEYTHASSHYSQHDVGCLLVKAAQHQQRQEQEQQRRVQQQHQQQQQQTLCSESVNPYTGHPTRLASCLESFAIHLDSPDVRFRGLEGDAATGNRFQRDPARLAGTVRLAVTPQRAAPPPTAITHITSTGAKRVSLCYDRTAAVNNDFDNERPICPAATAARLATLKGIQLRIRGTEKTVPTDAATGYGYRVVLDTKIWIWQRSANSNNSNDDDALERDIYFRLSIPPHCPASHTSVDGSISYHIDAMLYRAGGLPDVVVRHPFRVLRAPTKLEMEAWRGPTSCIRALPSGARCTWTGPTVVDLIRSANGDAVHELVVEGNQTVTVSYRLVRRAAYKGVHAPLNPFRKTKPRTWVRETLIGPACVAEPASSTTTPTTTSYPISFSHALAHTPQQDAHGALIDVSHFVAITVLDPTSATTLRVPLRIAPSY
ncbi:hypothetical protein DFJ77DRAFT_466000 [Powellomyces hirtus]|nr:hypothetical protein DFJ77DRAFT_466000 [Powellomyces hirtus]